ncbi:TIGR02391 family protein [Spirillospora sp. NPDC048911]|uniref:TIGR02391 family protein n=1 Tax=Spirillospora sp. NPDC048911 TaxID=3364527 RepID=UPI00371F7AB9
MATTLHPMWPPASVEAVCKVLASTEWPGLTGKEIGELLTMLGIPDVSPTANKRDRLVAALITKQQANQAGNCIIRFITEAMAPGRYLQDPSRFEALRDGLSEALALMGLRVNDEGLLARAKAARTLDDLARLAGRLQTELKRRGVHTEIMKYCEEEVLRKSLFHAVFEATKGLAERIRQMAHSTLDGADLVDHCFSTRNPPPVIRINSFATETEISEHKGFANLLKGVFGTFRNPPAHTPRATAGWAISEPDALDLFSTLSFMHRRLDNATVTLSP